MALEEIKQDSGSKGIWDSVKGALAGFFIIIPLSFVVVYYASQREQASEVLKKAIPYQKEKNAKEDQPVYVTGKIKAEPISDNLFLKSGSYLIIKRKSEIYAYESTKRSEKYKEGNTEKEKVIYECKLNWVSNPEESIKGKGCESESKINPKKTIPDGSNSTKPSILYEGTEMTIEGEISYISNMPPINIREEDLLRKMYQKGDYFYSTQSCIENPSLGCERISFTGISYNPQKEYTVIASVKDNKIVPFISKSGSKYVQMGEGTFKEAFSALEKSDTQMTIILFALSVILFWIGSTMTINPLLSLVEYIPIIGNFGAGLIRFVMLIFSLILMGITFLLIEYWYLILLLGILLIFGLLFLAKQKKQTA